MIFLNTKDKHLLILIIIAVIFEIYFYSAFYISKSFVLNSFLISSIIAGACILSIITFYFYSTIKRGLFNKETFVIVSQRIDIKITDLIESYGKMNSIPDTFSISIIGQECITFTKSNSKVKVAFTSYDNIDINSDIGHRYVTDIITTSFNSYLKKNRAY